MAPSVSGSADSFQSGPRSSGPSFSDFSISERSVGVEDSGLDVVMARLLACGCWCGRWCGFQRRLPERPRPRERRVSEHQGFGLTWHSWCIPDRAQPKQWQSLQAGRWFAATATALRQPAHSTGSTRTGATHGRRKSPATLRHSKHAATLDPLFDDPDLHDARSRSITSSGNSPLMVWSHDPLGDQVVGQRHVLRLLRRQPRRNAQRPLADVDPPR